MSAAAEVEPGRLLLTVEEAGNLLGIGRTLTYELIRSGALVSVRLGRLRRIRRIDLDAYAAALQPDPFGGPSAARPAA